MGLDHVALSGHTGPVTLHVPPAGARRVPLILVAAALMVSVSAILGWYTFSGVPNLGRNVGGFVSYSTYGSLSGIWGWTANHPPHLLQGVWVAGAWLLVIVSLRRPRLAGLAALPWLSGLFWLAVIGDPVAWPWRQPESFGVFRLVPSTGYWLAFASVLLAGAGAVAAALPRRPNGVLAA